MFSGYRDEGMIVFLETLLDFQAGNVFAPGGNNFLGPVLDLLVALRVTYSKIAGLKPSVGNARRAHDRTNADRCV